MTFDQNFQVDLRGVVDLLSHHLYSSPRVYLRELIQNAVDAITARTDQEAGAPRRIHLTPADIAADGRLHIRDSGIGLTDEEIRAVLATIGASTKRDELGFARDRFLGQFGIGLLSCFLVTDEIVLRTRQVGSADTWQWVGRADGTYAVTPAQESLDEPGTEVALTPRPQERDLLSACAVRELARTFAAYLPIELTIAQPDGSDESLSEGPFPWHRLDLVGVSRRTAVIELCERLLGFTPLDVIELADAEAGISGVACVLPVASIRRASHRLYAKNMLVSEAEPDVLPDWAVFVRAILTTDHLRLTASREALHQDDVLDGARERLGAQIRRWLLRTVQTDPSKARLFFSIHHLGVKALATQDDEMLDVVARILQWESSVGDVTLAEFAEGHRVISYVDNVQDFHQIAPLARAQGLAVLNAGFAYDVGILTRWLDTHPGTDAHRLTPQDLVLELDRVDDAHAARFSGLLAVAQNTLDRADCVPVLRHFAPDDVHGVLLTDRAIRDRQDRDDVAELLAGAWSDALELIEMTDTRPQLVLNAANAAVRRLADADPEVQQLGIEAIYAHVLVSGRHRLRPFDAALVHRALPALIDFAIDSTRPLRDTP